MKNNDLQVYVTFIFITLLLVTFGYMASQGGV